MRIGSNSLSFSMASELARTSRSIARALDRMGSGNRVASPREDIAGFSESVSLQSQARGMRQSLLAINQSQSLIETASSAISVQTELVARMRELAVQAASGTISSAERASIGDTLQGLLEEFQRISTDTVFGDLHLLDGSFGTHSVQLGAQRNNKIDLTTANHQASSIFSQTVGSGRFNTRSSGAVTGISKNLESADMNNDGLLDLVGVNSTTGLMYVELGNGDGSFQTARTSVAGTAGTGLADIAIVDLNGDGILDVAGVNSSAGNMAIYIGQGDGSFLSPITYATGSSPVSIAAADYNGDGVMDLFTLDSSSSTVSRFMNNGSGSFASRITTSVGGTGTDLVVSDINADGILDILTSHTQTAAIAEVSMVTIETDTNTLIDSKYVLLDNGQGTFHYFWFNSGAGADPLIGGAIGHQVNTSGLTTAKAMATALANVITADSTIKVTASDSGTGQVVLTNTATGAATDITDNSALIKTEIVTQGANATGSSGIYLRRGNSSGGYGAATTISASAADQIVTGDLNGDGRLDIAGSRGTAANQIAYFLQNGAGTFGSATNLTTGTAPTQLELADINGDGRLDIVTTLSTNSALNIFLNNGLGTFASRTTLTSLSNPNAIAIGDFNQDGALDIANGINSSTSAYQLFTGISREISGLTKFNVATLEDAQDLLSILDSASSTLNQSQSSLGALHSRLDFAASAQMLSAESVEEARARIEDPDIVHTVSELVRLQILQQAQIAVATQANLQLQVVMNLLK